MAIDAGPAGPDGGYPEMRYPHVRLDGPERMKNTLRTAAVAGGVLLAGGVALWAARRLRKTAGKVGIAHR